MSVKFETITDGERGRLVKAFVAGHPCVAGLGGTRELALQDLWRQIDHIVRDFDRSRMAQPQDADTEAR